MFENVQNNIVQHINSLNYAIRSCDLHRLTTALDEANRVFPLREIVLAEFYALHSNRQIDESVVPQYEDYVALANKYIDILQSELSHLQGTHMGYATFSQRATNQLYSSQGYFAPNQVIYQKDGKMLTVSNVLSVVGYAQKFIEALGVKIDGKYSIALMVLKTIDLALNNRKQDKPLNKALHLTNDVLTEVAKKAADDERAGQVISGTSLLVDLTIDFLVKE